MMMMMRMMMFGNCRFDVDCFKIVWTLVTFTFFFTFPQLIKRKRVINPSVNKRGREEKRERETHNQKRNNHN